MTTFLLMIAFVSLLGVLLSRVSGRTGMPSLVLFMALGLLFGSEGLLKIPFDDYSIAESACSIALLFIMFSGGFETNWKTAKVAAKPGILLSVGGVIITAGITGLFCYFVLQMPLLEGLLIGAVIGSTDAASVFSILRQKSLNLKNGLAPMLELESGSNDPTAYALTAIFLSLLTGAKTNLVSMFVLQMVFGVLFGILFGKGCAFVIKRVPFESDNMLVIFVLAVVAASYALPQVLGGNGYLSVYLTGILLGREKLVGKSDLVRFFSSIAQLMQIWLFFLLGLLAFPSQLIGAIVPAVLIWLFMTFVSRPIAVFSILTPFRKYSFKEQLLVSWAGLRGAAAIVFAIFSINSGAALTNDIYHIVFCVALLSVSLQGSMLPFLSKKLGLVDHDGNVLMTFNDYQDETDLFLREVHLDEHHPLANRTLGAAHFPADNLVVMIKRQGETIIPNGSTVLQGGDTLIVSSPAYRGDTSTALEQEEIYRGHQWENQTLAQLNLPRGTLVVAIKRAGETLVPKGDTRIQANDILLLHNGE